MKHVAELSAVLLLVELPFEFGLFHTNLFIKKSRVSEWEKEKEIGMNEFVPCAKVKLFLKLEVKLILV